MVLSDGKKEKAIQVMMNPNSDYLFYKDIVTENEIIQKLDQFVISNNMIIIDINSWLSDNGIEYLVQPFKYHKDAFSNDIISVKSELEFSQNWLTYIEKYKWFTIEEKFESYSFIYLTMKEPLYGMVRIIYIGSYFEEALQRLLDEFKIDEDIEETITENLISKGLSFQYNARVGKGDGYVELINSYQELLFFSELMGIKDLISKKYSIKNIDRVMTSFWDRTVR